MREYRCEIAPGVFFDFIVCVNYTVANDKDGKRKRKYIVKEQISGTDFSHDLNKEVFKERVIDRRNNYYGEEVVDFDNIEVIHYCEESLSEHYGHGSAKVKDNRNS